MGKVAAKVVGGSLSEYDVETIGDLKDAMDLEGNFTATVNGNPVDGDDAPLRDHDFVTFTQSVKGGR